MTTVALTERFAEAAGPIVVKEIRQGLRAKVFAIFFGLLLLACLVVALVAAADYDKSVGSDLGPDYFRLFLSALAVVEFFVIPYTAFRAMSREREDETWVLLALTGLGPRRIVRGKVTSALAQGLLYASACAPFVLFSYYLNGIDLPTVLVALVMAAAWSALLVCFAVAAATQAHSRIGRGISHFLVLGVLAGATAMGIGMAAVLSDEGGRLLRSEDGFRAFCACIFLWSLTSAWLLSESAASGLSLISENAVRGPRLALLVQMALAVGLGALIAQLTGHARDAAVAGSVITSLQLVMAGAFATSERDGFPPAFATTEMWLKPGALRGFALVTALLSLCTAGWAALFFSEKSSPDHLQLLLAGPLYVALYLSLGAVLGRLTPLRDLGEPLASRIGFVIVTFFGCSLPPFAALLLQKETDDRALNVLNPLLGMLRYARDNGTRNGLTLLAACALLAAFMAYTVLASRDVERRT